MGKKKPRFFCDGCGVEVNANEERCPRCGKFFASIRCPSCGFTGDHTVFDKGCPVCGYSAPVSKRPAAKPPPSAPPQWAYAVSAALILLILAVLFMYITH
jgi:predicted RNA-binding Zn-ribbon protein involved in translation (DUF1610 family)